MKKLLYTVIHQNKDISEKQESTGSRQQEIPQRTEVKEVPRKMGNPRMAAIQQAGEQSVRLEPERSKKEVSRKKGKEKKLIDYFSIQLY